MPRAERTEEGVLNDVIRVGFVACEGEGESIDVIDPRNCLALEGDATFSKCVISDLHVR
jgi:hypothetical protein